VAIGSGSQRAALRHPELAKSYTVIREAAPSAVVLANIGIYQLIDQSDDPALSLGEIETAIGMLDAQFLAIHLNALEEAIQPEGDTRTVGLLDALGELIASSPVPVIAKETGAGMSRETARDLVQVGVRMLDVGGAGGTSFARIEGHRAAMREDPIGERLGSTFSGWGIPSASSILEVVSVGVPVIATGGVRNGLHAAKAISLGATAVGVASPMLKAALAGPEAAKRELSLFIEELRLASQLSGCVDMGELGKHQPVLTGHTRQWAEHRGLI
jgi:isopentenyl-diphosphate delta-isomerase